MTETADSPGEVLPVPTADETVAYLTELMDGAGVPRETPDGRPIFLRDRVAQTIAFMGDQASHNARLVEAYAAAYQDRGDAIRRALDAVRSSPLSSNVNIRAAQRAVKRILLDVAIDKAADELAKQASHAHEASHLTDEDMKRLQDATAAFGRGEAKCDRCGRLIDPDSENGVFHKSTDSWTHPDGACPVAGDTEGET